MSQQFNPSLKRTRVRRLRGYFAVLATLLLTLAAPFAKAQTACNVVYTISSQWQGGFGAAITIQNTGTTAISNWTLAWAFANGQTISQLWSGTETQSGANVTVTNLSYDGSIPAGGSVTGVGFNGAWNNITNSIPTSFTLNGVTCGSGGAATGSFKLASSAATLAITQGSTTTDTIAVTDVSPFTGSVTLSATGLPSGVTATFGANPTTGSSVVTFAASAAAVAGTSTVTINGSSGSLTASTTVALTVGTAPSFTITPSAASLSVTPNASGTDAIAVTDLNGFTGNVTLTASGLPSGVTATFGSNPAMATSLLTFTAGSAATAGTSTVTITGTSGTLTASATIALSVTGAPSFTIAPSAASLSVAPGASGTDSIAVADLNGFAGSVTLAASGLPTGVTAAFGANPTTGSSMVAFTASSTAVAGTSAVTIAGTSGTLTASTTISLTVGSSTGPAMACNIGYAISSQSSSGNSGSFGAVITINNTGSTAWTSWTLTWTFANGQTFQSLWGGVETQSGANVTITSESYDGSIAPGSNTSQVGFNANWNGVTNAIPANFAINGTTCSSNSTAPSFTLSSPTSTMSVAESSSATDTISVRDLNGFTGPVTLAASNLPSGVTAAFGSNPTTGSSVVTFTAAASLPAGTPTVTITGTSGSVTATTTIALNVAGFSTVSVNQSTAGPAVTDQILGMNMAAWYDIVANETAVVDAFQTAGIKAVRWPGGSWSDVYHWQTNTNCQNAPHGGGTPDTNDVFANFVSDLAIPAGVDVALTADYGTNPACGGGGAPSEAASWAAAALTDGITVSHMTVGNEVYGNWEEDLHSVPNDPTTYAAAVVGSSGYYQSIKAASPNTLVGVVVDADNTTGGWDNTVLTNAKGSYDFVEYHYYPETPGEENDTTLINQDAQQLTANIKLIRSELAEWGTPNTPIYVGEIGGPYGTPGKQSMSITQALYAGQVLGELMNDGVSRLTWWIGFGGCADSTFGANFSSSLYGWQSFGGYMIFSDGLPDFFQCTAETLAPGILLPTARAFQLFSNVAVNGESALTANVSGDTTDVVAYAATHSGGTALVLFNRNETASEPVNITLSGQTTASTVTVETYNKAIYDLSGSPAGNPPDPAGTSTWAPPTTTSISSPTLPLNLTLTPWSMNVVIIH